MITAIKATSCCFFCFYSPSFHGQCCFFVMLFPLSYLDVWATVTSGS